MATKIITKLQTIIPQEIKEFLMENPVDVLTSQIKLDVDAVRLVKEARKDFK